MAASLRDEAVITSIQRKTLESVFLKQLKHEVLKASESFKKSTICEIRNHVPESPFYEMTRDEFFRLATLTLAYCEANFMNDPQVVLDDGRIRFTSLKSFVKYGTPLQMDLMLRSPTIKFALSWK